MATQEKASTEKTTLKSIATEGADKLEKVAKEATEQAVEAVVDSKEKLQEEAKVLNANVQGQLQQLKQDILQKIELLKSHFGTSQKDFTELKAFVKTEFNAVLDDLSKLGKDLKADVSEISGKHKEQITETFKRSKEHTLEAWKKVNPVKADAQDSTLKS